MEKYEVYYFLKEKSDKERFFIFTCVDGQGQINYSEGRQNLNREIVYSYLLIWVIIH